MKYVFNHFYILRHDEKRVVLCSHDQTASSIEVNKEWVSFIHPIYAMLLSFFCKPITIPKAVDSVVEFFGFSKEYAQGLIKPFIGNSKEFHTHYQGFDNNFPKNVIVESKLMCDEMEEWSPKDFVYSEIDLTSRRLFKAPLYVTFMLSNRCFTKCIYCYADGETKCNNLEFSKVEEIIEEAAQLKVMSFNLDGGEFFIYPYWRKLLLKLQEKRYKPDIVSTKFPIETRDIEDFSKFKIRLQVSLDSVRQGTLDKMVGHIKEYAERMRASLMQVDKIMSFQVATILTKYNGTVDELDEMYSFLSKLKNLVRWEVRVGFKSLYSKVNFKDIQISRSSIGEIQKWVEEKQKCSKFEILWSPGKEVDFFKANNGSSEFTGSRCSANSIHMFILPDGKVTICEQLYWNKNFLIGDLTKESITEVWNSKRALFLANMKAKDFSEESACRNCSIFAQCKANMNACFPNIMKVYGEENWDYPDPRCAKAPRNISETIYV